MEIDENRLLVTSILSALITLEVRIQQLNYTNIITLVILIKTMIRLSKWI